MHAKMKTTWICGICQIDWDAEQDAEWCCSPACDEVSLPSVVEEVQAKIVRGILEVM